VNKASGKVLKFARPEQQVKAAARKATAKTRVAAKRATRAVRRAA